VQGVLAIWGTLEGGVSERDRVLYVPGAELVGICRQRSRLSEAEIDAVARAIGAVHDRAT
jgi:hypothetical protein